MALRGLDDGGSGGDAQLANAIVYAADKGADVINASWGAAGTSQTIKDAIDYAHSLGALFVAAAGNSNIDAGGYNPANVSKALKVAAVDRSTPRRRSPTSAAGSTCRRPASTCCRWSAGRADTYC